jgi:hypothetical protein
MSGILVSNLMMEIACGALRTTDAVASSLDPEDLAAASYYLLAEKFGKLTVFY